MVKLSAAGKRALDDLITRFQSENLLPGFGIAVTSVDKELYASAGGYRVHDDPTGGSVTPDSLYWVCSMAKLITALAALILIEQGKLNLSDPASKYLPHLSSSNLVVLEGFMKTPTPTPRPAQDTSSITILHLLTHTSGSTYFAKPREPSYGLGMGYTFEQVGGRERAQEEFLEHIKEGYSGIPLAADPGTAFAYGYSSDILGIVIERVTGQSLADFCEENIFKPIGIKTTFRPNAELIEKLIEVHFRNEDGSISRLENRISLIQRYPKEVHLALGGMGAYSTLPDYAALLRYLLKIEAGQEVPNPILKQESVKTLFKPHLTSTAAAGVALAVSAWNPDIARNGVNWSTGFAVTTKGVPGKRRANSGFWGGWASILYVIDPTTGIAIVAGSQIIPRFDKRANELFDKAEAIVYASLEDGST